MPEWLRRLSVLLSFVAVVAVAPPALAQDDAGEDDEENSKEQTLVLERDATLEFTVDEGTWMSLDVSPDGSTIVFDLLGDVYTLPVEIDLHDLSINGLVG